MNTEQEEQPTKQTNKSTEGSTPSTPTTTAMVLDVSSFELGWVSCDRCRQWALVERGFAIPSPSSKWCCEMNKWNAPMAVCVPRKEFFKKLAAFYKSEAFTGTPPGDTAPEIGGCLFMHKHDKNKKANNSL